MQGNDISNAMPQRIIVTADVITDSYEDTKKVLGLIPVKTKHKEYNRLVLSHLYMVTLKRGITMELISFTHSESDMVELMFHLDKIGTNPFRYGSSYKSVDKLVAELPYRPEVIGVIDIPARLLRYGRWGMDFPSL
ncbi:hypothetical protein UFOVP115_36 [uncultured Caudovirales phage]|uniref:Uncharacterized protein n=1 Tax=uncultured Caudovirales phage TaxID=2100421 RepID=A0A6J5L5C9_9CAUD|nr:hypothetical protein UFOVP115_36 [uncultured Caudovirales phage]